MANKKIYLLSDVSEEILLAFSTREKAEEYIQQKLGSGYIIREVEFDQEPKTISNRWKVYFTIGSEAIATAIPLYHSEDLVNTCWITDSRFDNKYKTINFNVSANTMDQAIATARGIFEKIKADSNIYQQLITPYKIEGGYWAKYKTLNLETNNFITV